MTKSRKYQLSIALESSKVLLHVMGIHRKRPVVMKRYRKLVRYMERSLVGKGNYQVYLQLPA